MNLRNNGRPRKKYVDDGSDEELDFMMPSIKKKRRDVLPKSPQNAPAPQPTKVYALWVSIIFHIT
jgi:hypothetical protein